MVLYDVVVVVVMVCLRPPRLARSQTRTDLVMGREEWVGTGGC
jgi:hypothetical protein